MNDSTAIPLLKQCSRKDNCVNSLGCWLPATTEYFYRHSKSKDGLQPRCIECNRVCNRVYREDHLEELRAISREWGRKNPEKRNESVRRWRETHTEEARERDRIRYAKDPQKRNATSYAAKKKNLEKYHLIQRRAQSRARGNTGNFTDADQQRMLRYWNNRCAVCGREPDFWSILAYDHWVPVKPNYILQGENPGTCALNILPLCHGRKGQPGGRPCCNTSKGNRNPEEWVIKKFGKRKGNQILAKIKAYFLWIKEQSES